MIKLLILISLLLSFYYIGWSQEFKPELQIPSSPGMTIIGIQNTEITKPGNYAGVYTNLIYPILSNNGTIPTDLAIEFSPYYFQSQDITYKELSKTDIYRDLKISVASNKVIAADSSQFSRLGLGFRTNLLAGKINNVRKNKITLSLPSEINTIISKIKNGLYPNIDEANIETLVEKIKDQGLRQRISKIIIDNKNSQDELLSELEALNDEIDKLVQVDGSRWDYSLRTGHFIEIASAFAFDFPENTIASSKINRWGVWLNYTYRPESKKQSIDIGAIIRLSNYSFDPSVIFDKGSVFGDLGVSINWKIPETKFIVSYELISKAGFSDFKASNGSNEFTLKSVKESKWDGSIGYQITPNILWNISFSDINGNSDYLKNNTVQFIMGLSAALAPIQK